MTLLVPLLPTLDEWPDSGEFRPTDMGSMRTSGALAFADLDGAKNATPLKRRVPEGAYPVTLYASGSGPTARNGFVVVRFSNAPVVRWELATEPGEDVADLDPNQTFGCAINQGPLTLGDAVAMKSVDPEAHNVGNIRVGCAGPMALPIDLPTRALLQLHGGDVALFEVFGKGLYAGYFGLDAIGEAACLVVPFAPSYASPKHLPDAVVDARVASIREKLESEDEEDRETAFNWAAYLASHAPSFTEELVEIASVVVDPDDVDQYEVRDRARGAAKALGSLIGEDTQLAHALGDALDGDADPSRTLVALRVMAALFQAKSKPTADAIERTRALVRSGRADAIGHAIRAEAIRACSEGVRVKAIDREPFVAEMLPLVDATESRPVKHAALDVLGFYSCESPPALRSRILEVLLDRVKRPTTPDRDLVLRAIQNLLRRGEYEAVIGPLIDESAADEFDLPLRAARVVAPVATSDERIQAIARVVIERLRDGSNYAKFVAAFTAGSMKRFDSLVHMTLQLVEAEASHAGDPDLQRAARGAIARLEKLPDADLRDDA